MPTVSEVAVSLTGICATVPSRGHGICDVCHGCPGSGWTTCWSCDRVIGQVSRPCSLVVPISLYEIPSQLHHTLLHYKSGRYPHLESEFGARVACLLAYFLAHHGNCVKQEAGGDWDMITSVPSSQDRVGEHPLVRAINRVGGLRSQYRTLLTKGRVRVDHLNASDLGYSCTTMLDGERILLVDDTFTSGARAQSAASALNLAGGDVVAIVPVGRVINPSFSETVAEYWARQRRIPFDFNVCCLESGADQEEEPW